jgi:hypothetical protein
LVIGLLLGLVSLVLGLTGWPGWRLWFYYLVSALLTLVGLQLVIAWVQMQVLEALKTRDELVAGDMRGNGESRMANGG